MGKPEDADPAPIIRIHPARGVVESTIRLVGYGTVTTGPSTAPSTTR